MEATAKKSGFKESVKQTGQKAKAYAGKKVDQVKTYGKNYKSDIVKAYDIGYAKGWDDAYNVPKRFGAKIAASYGYKKGIRDRRRADKYTKQYNKMGKQN